MGSDMKRKLLTKAVCLALAIPCMPALAQDAATTAPQEQQAAEQDRNDDAKDLDTVVVTGSRIPRAVPETAAPSFTNTAE
jgi:hypothetical protein